jgi:hypothetical protein
MATTVCYYGLSFSSTELSGDPYVNFWLNVFIEVPSYVAAAVYLDWWGRKPILITQQVSSQNNKIV